MVKGGVAGPRHIRGELAISGGGELRSSGGGEIPGYVNPATHPTSRENMHGRFSGRTIPVEI